MIYLSQSSSGCNETFRSQDSSNYDVLIIKSMVTEQTLTSAKSFESGVVKSGTSLFEMKKAIYNMDSLLFLIIIFATLNNSHWLLTGSASCTGLCFPAVCQFIQFFSWTEALTGEMAEMTLIDLHWDRHFVRIKNWVPPASQQSHAQTSLLHFPKKRFCWQEPCNCRLVGHLLELGGCMATQGAEKKALTEKKSRVSKPET